MSGSRPARQGQAVSVETFIARWSGSGAAERANYQLFLSELCDVLDVPRPNPTVRNESENTYVFEKRVTFTHPDGTTTEGRIDLYKKGHFILEAKRTLRFRWLTQFLTIPGSTPPMVPPFESR